MKFKGLVCAIIAGLTLNQGLNAQSLIGVSAPTGTTRSDTYSAAGYEFYAPSGTGTTINALGFWDQNGTGLLAAHTVSLFQYNGANYSLLATVTVPSGTNAPLINGYRWVGIPTLNLPDNGQGGGYYAILAAQNVDAWTDGTGGGAPVMNSAIGTISGKALTSSSSANITTSPINIVGNASPSTVYGGANLGFLTNALPASSGSILWGTPGTFTNSSVLALAGAAASEVYGVDFGGSGLQTTANGYTFDDYSTTGNMNIDGSGTGLYGGYLTGAATTGDGALDTVLTFGLYGGSANTGTLNHLTVGKTYTVLALLDDTRSAAGGTTFNVQDGLTTSPSQQYAFLNGSPAVGGYVIGTFTAAATTQPFTVRNGGSSQYNAVILFTNPPPVYPVLYLITNIQPTAVSAGINGQAAFTAAFSNSPAVNLQWQFIANGVTNNINVGVVSVTNGGIVSSTLTLTNLQLANAGSYRLKAVDATNSLNVAYSSAASLSVVPLIQWLQTGTFTDNTVLALAGTAANEVYGVDFGGSGLQTTANGYTFDDYGTTGNMNIAGSGTGLYGGYLTGAATTGDGALDTVLTFGLYGGAVNTGTLNNLTIGQTYKVIALVDDTRTGAGSQNPGTAFAGTDGVFLGLAQPFVFGNSTPVGGYALGTFTALATNEPLSILTQTTAGNFGNCQYNAILLVKATAPLLPPIYLAANTSPASVSAGTGSQVVFTAAYFNVPPVTLQWQVITNGVTNNISGGIVTVTNLGIVSSTLTLSNVQPANAGSYRLRAVNATNSSDVVYSTAAPLTIIPVITWGTTGAFSDNTVLALAGTPANEVYGVDFGGSGLETTANGYTFDDYGTTGNMSIAGSGTGLYGGYLTGGATTGDGALDTVLTFGLYGGTANTGILNNLTVGQKYTVLALLDDTRGGAAGGITFRTTDGATFSPSPQYAFANGSPSVGGYIMGTFTATATTQAFSVQNYNSNNYGGQYNAILLEKFSTVQPPVLVTSKVSGGNLILTGTGGVANAGYTWLTTTNLAAPITWTTNATGTFDGAGAFSNTIPINVTTPARFFRLRTP